MRLAALVPHFAGLRLLQFSAATDRLTFVCQGRTRSGPRAGIKGGHYTGASSSVGPSEERPLTRHEGPLR